MNVAGRDQPHLRMALEDRRKLRRIAQVLAIHVGNAGLKRRMMHENQRRPIGSGSEFRIEPLQRLGIEAAIILARHRGIQQQQHEPAYLDAKICRP